ncbi:IS110 family transposase [Weissella confusa]|uniref:IS110 family transposase n=1 Tax=Weissella confusa TaxID=1583 RepID=UPI0022E7908C|nr:IS110 family transposase [Weissella confusa]
MDVAYTRACGIDVHQKSVSVSLLIGDFDTNRPKRTNRKYDTTTNSLKELACWLDDNDVQVATMESTGQYWRPVWQILSRYSHTELKLVNPQKIKRMPGRKTDKKDAEWLVDLTRVGMIEPSYVPELPTIELRESTRLRKNLTQQLTVIKNEIHNILQRSNIKLTSYLSDIFGPTGMKMLGLLLNGEAINTETVTPLMHRRMKATVEEIVESLNGRLSKNDRYLIDIQLGLFEELTRSISDIEAHIQEQTNDFEELRIRLMAIPGISDNTAAIIMAEIGTNVDAFENEQAIAAWAGLCPGSYESGGKTYSSKTNRGNKYIKSALSQSALTARKRRDTDLSNFYYRLAGRIGKAKAVIALAHKLLRIIYVMIRDGVEFNECKLKSRPFPLEQSTS